MSVRAYAMQLETDTCRTWPRVGGSSITFDLSPSTALACPHHYQHGRWVSGGDTRQGRGEGTKAVAHLSTACADYARRRRHSLWRKSQNKFNKHLWVCIRGRRTLLGLSRLLEGRWRKSILVVEASVRALRQQSAHRRRVVRHGACCVPPRRRNSSPMLRHPLARPADHDSRFACAWKGSIRAC